MERVILAGEENALVPLYERLRGGGAVEVVGLGSDDPDSLTAILAVLAGIPCIGRDAEEAPAADLWVCDASWPARTRGTTCLDFAEADRRWPTARATAGKSASLPLLKKASTGREPVKIEASAFMAFPRELQREILRSKRYHLGFTLSLFRILNDKGAKLGESAFQREPLASFPAREGRACDSWGLSREGYLLHLAPEILEQASSLKRRIGAALERELDGISGNWRVLASQARFPKDAESGRELLGIALQRLERQVNSFADEGESQA